MAKNELLPSHHDQFRAKSYWDSFFQQRKKEAFEWYGDYSDLKQYLQEKVCKEEDHVLVVGCGNSELSSSLYDDGVQKVTNIDFSESVIKEMREKNVQRLKMQWEVMDVRALSLPSESFDVVLDKGALDAIFSSESAEISADVDKMLQEICRVLKPQGRYLCVTMAQDFVLRKLLATYLKSEGWSIEIEEIRKKTVRQREEDRQNGKKESPFSPFFVLMTKTGQAPSAITVSGREPPLKSEKGNDNSDKEISWALTHVRDNQEFRFSQHELRKMKVGEIRTFELWAEGTVLESPKYVLSVVDHSLRSREKDCAVFITPQGREHEWLFSSPEGMKQLAATAGYNRLIVVRLGLGYSFSGMEAVQDELSPKVIELLPATSNKDSGGPGMRALIPFMSVPQGIGSKRVVYEGESKVSGRYLIEDVPLESPGEDGRSSPVYRRLIFLKNRNLIQSEVRMLPLSKSSKKARRRKNKKKNAGGNEEGATHDEDGEDDAVKTEEEGRPEEGHQGKIPVDRGYKLDLTYMSEYHHAMAAGIVALNPSTFTGPKKEKEKTAQQQGIEGPTGRKDNKGLVIGLGGGALPMYLKAKLPHCSLAAVELDNEVVEIARGLFGLVEDQRLSVTVADGIDFVREAPEGDLDFLIVDVDSKDISLPLSCPPEAFLCQDFLESCHRALSPTGSLVLNLATRSTDILEETLQKISKVFAEGEVYTIVPSAEEINRVIFASKEKKEGIYGRGREQAPLLDEPWVLGLDKELVGMMQKMKLVFSGKKDSEKSKSSSKKGSTASKKKKKR